MLSCACVKYREIGSLQKRVETKIPTLLSVSLRFTHGWRKRRILWSLDTDRCSESTYLQRKMVAFSRIGNNEKREEILGNNSKQWRHLISENPQLGFKIYYRLYSSRPWDIWHEWRVFIMFLLNLSYRFISGDVDIRNKEIIQKSELKTKNMGRERNTSRELK